MNDYDVSDLNWFNDELWNSSINDSPFREKLLKCVKWFEVYPSLLINNEIHVMSLKFTPRSDEEAIEVLQKMRLAHSLGQY